MIETQKLKLLHGLRGFAALIVVIAHSKFPFWIGGQKYIEQFPMTEWNAWDYLLFALDMITSNATVMVIVFFVLSGFFIAYSFNVNKWTIKQFYINRFIRIYLPYFGSILFTLACVYLASIINPQVFSGNINREYNQDIYIAFQNFNLNSFLWTCGFIAKPVYFGYNYPYWSLLTEVVFYLVIPFFVFKPRVFLITMMSLFIILLFFPLHVSKPFFLPAVLEFFSLFGVFFAIGVFLYYFIFANVYPKRWLAQRPVLMDVLILVTFLSSMALGHIISHVVTYFIGAAFASLVIFRILEFPLKTGFVSRIMIFLGKISYSVYLIHVPLFILLYAIVSEYSGQWLFTQRIYWVAVLVAILVSYGFYLAIEEQSLKIIKHLKRKKNAAKLKE